MSLFWHHVRFFRPIEMACSHCGQEFAQKALMLRLDQVRERYGKPMVISSGCRCRQHPIEAAKAKPGVHATGYAADIACSGADALVILKHALDVGFTRIGVQQKGEGRFLHLDCYEGDEFVRPALWSY